jgi:hypothetical protein
MESGGFLRGKNAKHYVKHCPSIVYVKKYTFKFFLSKRFFFLFPYLPLQVETAPRFEYCFSRNNNSKSV